MFITSDANCKTKSQISDIFFLFLLLELALDEICRSVAENVEDMDVDAGF